MKNKRIRVLSILLLVIICFSSIMLLAGCGEEPGKVYDMGSIKLSASTNKVTFKQKMAAYNSDDYLDYHRAWLKIECRQTGVYMFEAKEANTKADYVYFNVTDSNDPQLAYYYNLNRDPMYVFTTNPDTKGAYRSFALRLYKGKTYYVGITHDHNYVGDYTLRITWSKDSYTTTQTSDNKTCLKGKLLDSMVWCSILSRYDRPRKDKDVDEIVMIAYLNRHDTSYFYQVLANLPFIDKLNVKANKPYGELAWFVISNTVLSLPPGEIADSISIFVDLIDIIKGFTTNQKQYACFAYDDEYKSVRGNSVRTDNISANIGTKVIIKRSYDGYNVTCENWNDLVTKTHKSERLEGPTGGFGGFFKVSTLTSLAEGQPMYIKTI